MIRIEHVTLPPGLRAIAGRDANGHLVIYVSNALDPKGQRAAVMEAVRASRRAGWRGVLPIWIGLIVMARLFLGRIFTAIRAQPATLMAATAAVAAAATVAGIIVASSPHSTGPAAVGPGPGPSATSSGLPRTGGHGSHSSQVQPVAAVPPRSSAGQPVPGQTSPGHGSSTPPSTGRTSSSPPAPGSSSPTTSSQPPSPAPTSSSQPATSPSPSCLDLLGIHVCLHL